MSTPNLESDGHGTRHSAVHEALRTATPQPRPAPIISDDARAKKAIAEADAKRMSFHDRHSPLLEKRDRCLAAVAQIDAARPALLARLLLTGKDMAEDDATQNRRARCLQFIERVEVAAPAMKEILEDLGTAQAEARGRRTRREA